MPIAVHRDSVIRNLRIPTLAQMIREAQEFSKPRLKRLTCEALLEWFNQSERLLIARTHYHLRGPRFIDFGERIGVDQSSAYQLVKLIPYKARILARCADEGRSMAGKPVSIGTRNRRVGDTKIAMPSGNMARRLRSSDGSARVAPSMSARPRRRSWCRMPALPSPL
jgi:hypothetical protein